MKTNLRERLTK